MAQSYAAIPHAMYVDVPGMTRTQAHNLSQQAVTMARRIAPKLSGISAAAFQLYFGDGFFGITFSHDYVWWQEVGTRARTMRELAGKVIPMWIDDPRGELKRQNPKAETRTTRSGRRQTLIFRQAARMGQTKTVRRDGRELRVPASYPGAAGRIGVREAASPWTTPGKVGGRIAVSNIGVRWRHPGLQARGFIHHSLMTVARANAIAPKIMAR